MKTTAVRDKVLERDGFRCVWCGTIGSKKNPLQMHHVIPRAQGGETSIGNLITLCRSCHEKLHRKGV